MHPETVSEANRRFWDELCGSDLARSLQLPDDSAGSLRRFDEAYFSTYPYLEALTTRVSGEDDVLEIGLGYGSVGGKLAQRAGRYVGLDIAPGPVQFMRRRLEQEQIPASTVNGSALDLPFADDTFTDAFAIGSLHHTGDLRRSVEELGRVVRPGGRAVVMLYARWCWRTLSPFQIARYIKRLPRQGSLGAVLRSEYDANAAGVAAPHIDFVSRRDVRRLFSDWSDVTIVGRNLGTRNPRDPSSLERRGVDTSIENILGQDLYITAVR